MEWNSNLMITCHGVNYIKLQTKLPLNSLKEKEKNPKCHLS